MRRAMVFTPRSSSQQSKGPSAVPSAFCKGEGQGQQEGQGPVVSVEQHGQQEEGCN